VDTARKRGVEPPEFILNAPILGSGLSIYYEAFTELSTCRYVGNVPGPIPWLAVDRFAIRHGYEDEEFSRLVRLMRAMDDAFLRFLSAKRETEAAKHGNTEPVRG
jgi:hypothetical protein